MEQIQKNRKKANYTFNYTLIRVCSFVTALGLTVTAPFFIKGKTSKGKIYYPTKIITTKVDFNDYYSLINTNEAEMYDKEQKENHIALKVIEHSEETYTINGKSNKTDKISYYEFQSLFETEEELRNSIIAIYNRYGNLDEDVLSNHLGAYLIKREEIETEEIKDGISVEYTFETTEKESKVLPYSKQEVKNKQIVATAITGIITLGGATIISINTRKRKSKKRTRNEQ